MQINVYPNDMAKNEYIVIIDGVLMTLGVPNGDDPVKALQTLLGVKVTA